MLWAECCAFFFRVTKLFQLLKTDRCGTHPGSTRCWQHASSGFRKPSLVPSLCTQNVASFPSRLKWFRNSSLGTHRPLHTKLRVFSLNKLEAVEPPVPTSRGAHPSALCYFIRSEWAHFHCASPHVSYLYGMRAASLSCVVSRTTKRYLHEPKRGLKIRRHAQSGRACGTSHTGHVTHHIPTGPRQLRIVLHTAVIHGACSLFPSSFTFGSKKTWELVEMSTPLEISASCTHTKQHTKALDCKKGFTFIVVGRT